MSNPEDQNKSEIEENAASAQTAEEVEGEVLPPETDEAQSGETEAKQEPDVAAELSAVEQLESAQADALKYKDAALRAEAEMQNLRRRTANDLEKAHKYALDKLVQNLLPVVDSLEKGIESAEQAGDDAGNKAIIEGVSLCHKMMIDVLGKEGVVVVDPQGEPFDPNLHQAMSMIENPDVEPNSVVAVIQKGFTLNGRLVRPAMVMVSKPAPKIDATV